MTSLPMPSWPSIHLLQPAETLSAEKIVCTDEQLYARRNPIAELGPRGGSDWRNCFVSCVSAVVQSFGTTRGASPRLWALVSAFRLASPSWLPSWDLLSRWLSLGMLCRGLLAACIVLGAEKRRSILQPRTTRITVLVLLPDHPLQNASWYWLERRKHSAAHLTSQGRVHAG